MTTLPDGLFDGLASLSDLSLYGNPGRSAPIFSPTALTVDERDMTSYTVRLNTEPTGRVTVAPGVNAGSDLIVTGTLTFGPTTWNTEQTVTVTALADADGTTDIATINHTVTGYDSMPERDRVIVVVTDVLRAPIFGAARVADQTYTVDTPIPTLTLQVDVAGTNTPRYTLSGLPTGLTFDAAARTVRGVPTMMASAVTLTYTAADGTAASDSVYTDTLTFTVTVVVGPGVTFEPTALTVEEGSTLTIYTVVLDTVPTGAVTVTPTPDSSGEVHVAGALTFSVADWNTAQTVTVTAVRDADNTTDTATITHDVTGYGSVTAADIVVTVRDSAPLMPCRPSDRPWCPTRPTRRPPPFRR